ncbi:Asp/Glu racemase [Diaphorobacter sp. HDW4A]|uniref:aspartate/glutamate racemase family protein n=1 Tax=Diaphorobacter sp. HDW4A TaxID=2714924 RepID=UPI001408C05B|nr:aspartate/glutamate racemase family protein [Diaphorobacter sp. HDW4A]QIL82611.1 Asp/Glu racemase [Diaphorobacter sp. HDW4A]
MTQRTVLLINPNTSQATTAAMHRLARASLPQGLELRSVTAERGASMITNDAELATSVEQVLELGRRLALEVDAVVIGAFGNPGLAALRGALSIPVIGIGEASMREAALGGRRFGVATTTPGLEASIAASAQALGLSALFCGSRIPASDPLALARDPQLQDEALAQAIADCIVHDGAQAVIVGGGPLSESAERIAPRFQVPVISPVAAAMRDIASLPRFERQRN